jgi:RNA polymerase sigma-70 factor (ECF subfamily)
MLGEQKETPVMLARGDRKGFEAIVDRYQKAIFNMAYRMVSDYEDAMDITQLSFIKAYENLDKYDRSRKFFSWLYKIAVNEAINYIAKNKRQRRLNYDASRPGESRSLGATPEDHLAQSETEALLQSSLMHLKFDYRVVLILRHFMSFSYREVGEILDVPEKTVKSRLYTGRQLLKDILVEQGYVE